jgi:hypothetical protein
MDNESLLSANKATEQLGHKLTTASGEAYSDEESHSQHWPAAGWVDRDAAVL